MPKKVYDDDKLRAEAMRLRRLGYSYREIARGLGCSVYKVHELISEQESPGSRLKQAAELAARLDELSSRVEVIGSRIESLESSVSSLRTLEDLTNELSIIRKEVEDLKNSFSRRIDRIAQSIDLISLSAEERVRDGRKGCRWLSRDGYCTKYWFSKVGGLSMKRDTVGDKIVYRLNVKKHPLICTACPSYEPRGY